MRKENFRERAVWWVPATPGCEARAPSSFISGSKNKQFLKPLRECFHLHENCWSAKRLTMPKKLRRAIWSLTQEYTEKTYTSPQKHDSRGIDHK